MDSQLELNPPRLDMKMMLLRREVGTVKVNKVERARVGNLEGMVERSNLWQIPRKIVLCAMYRRIKSRRPFTLTFGPSLRHLTTLMRRSSALTRATRSERRFGVVFSMLIRQAASSEPTLTQIHFCSFTPPSPDLGRLPVAKDQS